MLETKVTDALGHTAESYTYDFERLKEILYPKNVFNRVTYTYGQAGDKYSRAGSVGPY